MKRILLVCGAGMSTSILVHKMQENDKDNNYSIQCCDTMSALILAMESDIVLLAPHISYMKDDYIPICKKLNIPFMVIDSLDYTHMNGEIVLKKAENMLVDFHKENPFKVLLLHCTGGVMSDLIVMDMKKKVTSEEKNWIIESQNVEDFDDSQVSIILLEPQVRFEEVRLKKMMENKFTIINVPPFDIYASFNGRKMLDYIQSIYIKEKIKLKEGLENI